MVPVRREELPSGENVTTPSQGERWQDSENVRRDLEGF